MERELQREETMMLKATKKISCWSNNSVLPVLPDQFIMVKNELFETFLNSIVLRHAFSGGVASID
jgi:hypothetical protein